MTLIAIGLSWFFRYRRVVRLRRRLQHPLQRLVEALFVGLVFRVIHA